MLPADHPQRFLLADELHARPPQPVETPSRVSYLALLIDPEERAREGIHIATLCERHGVVPPAQAATHFIARLGAVQFKWERHGEFSGYTFIATGLSSCPFNEPAASLLPLNWIAKLPGSTIAAAHAEVIQATSEEQVQNLAEYFGANTPVGADISEGAARVYTDFRIHGDGFSRFLVCNRTSTPRQTGRTMQRLFEIEAYRMLALLALPIARRQSARTLAIEHSLAQLTDRIAADGGEDEALLQALTRLAAEVESGLTASQFRFEACRAYHELVVTRIEELRERRMPGTQTIEEFMKRRLTPGVSSCATASRRLQNLSKRVTQASNLLSTRVNIASERQNQSLLTSMDRRASQQLRLQQTVEGLSVAAIVYYAAGLVGYVAKAMKVSGIHVEPDFLVGAALPLLTILVVNQVRRARRRHSATAMEAGGNVARDQRNLDWT